ncbi:hypothetical protein SYNPS1DRAFT_26641 [Syncephalis pseudoplumigaleata]|uniref:Uncharacterized protein n=1 Tax=Syncephalis pseudoplumigaleata TaxID=1712513 RepID=A0A4P9Z5I7_9FUNG|nr:hypothetical protein SYNPS1DRAFT_26641 [Syncephalis pseudoplumigaleata]|eukprot:RKP27718.1 hypothetical protein SYNPS1DRAFT_26641 [Syncephalis pseudoplumigaleata]
MGAAIQAMYNVNRDKRRSIQVAVENHHGTLRLSGVRFHCGRKSQCDSVPSHVVDAGHSQSTHITAIEPNTACSGYMLYRLLDARPTQPDGMELFALVVWEVPVVGTNRCLLEVLQASAGIHLLRRESILRKLVEARREHRLMPAAHVQCQGWRVADKAFMATVTMSNTVDARLTLRIENIAEDASNLLSSPEAIRSTGNSIDWGCSGDPMASSKKSPMRQEEVYCGMVRKANMVVQISNQTRHTSLRNIRFYIREGSAVDQPVSDIAPKQQQLIPLVAHRKLKGYLVCTIDDDDDDKQSAADGHGRKTSTSIAATTATAAAYREHGLFLVVAWYVHPRKGNRLWVDVVRAREDVFPGGDQPMELFYDNYIRYLLSSTTRPSVWMTGHGRHFSATSFIDAGLHDVVLLLDLADVPSSHRIRTEAPLFLPSSGIGVTMNNSLAEMTDMLARRVHWKQQQLVLILENTHHDLVLTPIWPADHASPQISQGRHEIAILNRARLLWSTEGIRIYQLILRNPPFVSLDTIYFLAVRARDTELSMGIVATWASAYTERSIDMDGIVDYVRQVATMNQLPMARHSQQDIRLNGDAVFQLTAYRNPSIPFTLTLTVGHASNQKGHVNAPIPPKLRITMLNDHSGLQLGEAQVFSTGYHLAAAPDITLEPMPKSVFHFDSLPANEERDVYLVHALDDHPGMLRLWFTVCARGELIGYRVRCLLDEQEIASLDMPLSSAPSEHDEAANGQQRHPPRSCGTIATFNPATDGSTRYVALYVGGSLNGERTELIVCWADQREKVDACIQASNEHLRSSMLVMQPSQDNEA